MFKLRAEPPFPLNINVRVILDGNKKEIKKCINNFFMRQFHQFPLAHFLWNPKLGYLNYFKKNICSYLANTAPKNHYWHIRPAVVRHSSTAIVQ